jgi:hypothetical protein
LIVLRAFCRRDGTQKAAIQIPGIPIQEHIRTADSPDYDEPVGALLDIRADKIGILLNEISVINLIADCESQEQPPMIVESTLIVRWF